jgi:hypothetical protein
VISKPISIDGFSIESINIMASFIKAMQHNICSLKIATCI